jgi:hypothetical protein
MAPAPTTYSGFEWDDNKRRANAVKHGLDFADAAGVFKDPKQFVYRSPHIAARPGLWPSAPCKEGWLQSCLRRAQTSFG